jgi:ankyrin repeat protein
LDELPVTLDETYERILLEIDKEKREHAIRLLQCLAISPRPLRAKELAEVLAIQFDTTIPTLDTSLRPSDAEEAILSACSTLVTVVKYGGHKDDYGDTRFVQFFHYSVKEYLTSDRLANSERSDLSQYYISPEPAHVILAQSCIATLLQLDNHIEDISHSFPLAEYAAQNWLHHAQFHGVTSRIRDGIERLFDPDRKHLAAWVSVHDIDHVSSRPRHSEPPKSFDPCPLYYAVLCGIGSLVEHLIIKRGQDPNKSRGNLGTPLHVAVVLGYSEIARILLEHTADVNFHDGYISSPLHVAVERGKLDIMRLLLGYDADINVLDHWVGSPLQGALQYRKFDVVELLVNGGADIDVRDKYNSTPLHTASRSGDLDIARSLLSHGADADALDHRGDSPLHQSSRNRNFSVVELLVEHGANLNVQGKYNSTPLHEASASGNLDVAQLLLSHGADINVFDPWGDSPLHKASRYQKIDVVELLVKGGADVNSRDMTKSTPLHEASRSRSLDIAKFLLSQGADVNALDIWGDSPLHESFRSLTFEVAEPPLKARLKDARDLYDGTLITRTSSGRNSDPVQPLSRTDIMNSENDGCPTPLHDAPQGGKYAMARLLLEHGADVNARGWRLRTPLHLAAFEGSIDGSRLLVERGADVDAQNDDDQTPFAIASARGHDELAQFLSSLDRILEKNIAGTYITPST